MGPKWAPQIENGKATASTYIMPIRIKIPTPEKNHAKPENDSLNTIMEHPPLPVGGVDKFRNWLAANYVIPSEAVKAKVKGQLVATFVIDKEGKLTDIEITEDLGYGTGKAYKALLGHAAPWQAGIENGRPVRVKYTLPIQINVN